jgi:putative ATP-binding cassette transporter
MQSQTIPKQSQKNSDSKLNFLEFWNKLKLVLGAYWYPIEADGRVFSEVIKSWGMLILLLSLIIGLVAVTAFNSFILRQLVNVIDEKNLSGFTNNLSILIVSFVFITLLTGLSKFVREKMALDWYEWLNNYMLQKYFSNRAYYKINFDSNIENPDQRLTQEIKPIAKTTLSFFATCVEKILEMIVFFVILWQISKTIGVVLIIYTTIGNLIAFYLSQEFNKINQEELEVEANYNYAVTHVRNHAESIAFFQGEDQEFNILKKRFSSLIQTALQKINWERSKNFFDRGYQSIINVFPFLLVAPLYIRDEIDFGQVNQASLAANLFATALGTLITEFATSGRLSSYIERLVNFSETLETITQQAEGVSTIKSIEENRLAFEDVTLQTPNYEKVIVENLTIELAPEQGLLIVGPSGRGKSSLLRAIAGLWNSGTGRLIRPPGKEILFLPQRPYIILGTLREQLLYPNVDRQVSDHELSEVLQQVNLQDVLTRVGGFDQEVPWENILSLGEQQRLAFARILVTRPHFVILDESTSALDLINEKNLYQQLKETKTTFISVGHRESLFDYHQTFLELLPDSTWKISPVSG